jgi:hypothetical protein
VARRIYFMAEVKADGGWECGIMAEVVVVDDEVCGCVAEMEGWR